LKPLILDRHFETTTILFSNIFSKVDDLINLQTMKTNISITALLNAYTQERSYNKNYLLNMVNNLIREGIRKKFVGLTIRYSRKITDFVNGDDFETFRYLKKHSAMLYW
jgi:hypothetical protein